MQARPCPTFGRPVHLRDGSLDYGPVLLLMPFGSHLTVDTLPSGDSESSPASEAVNPAFGYDAPHPSIRGTSTLLNNALLSAQYKPLRHPTAPGPSLTGVRLLVLTTPWGFPCCVRFPCVHAVATTPAQRLGASSARFPSCISLPRYGSRVSPRIDLFEACSAFTCVTACTLTLPPYFVARFTEGFNRFVTSTVAPVASGSSSCRVGLSPSGKAPPFHGARQNRKFDDLDSLPGSGDC